MRTIKSVKASCWKLLSQKIRKNEPYCARCLHISKSDPTYQVKPTSEVHHIFGRRINSTFLHEPNLIPLCSGCHMFATDSFEQSPYSEVNQSVLLERLGENGLEELQEKSREYHKFILENLLNIEKSLKS